MARPARSFARPGETSDELPHLAQRRESPSCAATIASARRRLGDRLRAIPRFMARTNNRCCAPSGRSPLDAPAFLVGGEHDRLPSPPQPVHPLFEDLDVSGPSQRSAARLSVRTKRRAAAARATRTSTVAGTATSRAQAVHELAAMLRSVQAGRRCRPVDPTEPKPVQHRELMHEPGDTSGRGRHRDGVEDDEQRPTGWSGDQAEGRRTPEDHQQGEQSGGPASTARRPAGDGESTAPVVTWSRGRSRTSTPSTVAAEAGLAIRETAGRGWGKPHWPAARTPTDAGRRTGNLGATTEGDIMIEAKGLTKRYGDRYAVEGPDLHGTTGVVTGFLDRTAPASPRRCGILGLARRPAVGDGQTGKPTRHTGHHCGRSVRCWRRGAVHPGAHAIPSSARSRQSNRLPRSRVLDVIDGRRPGRQARRRAGGSPSAWSSGSASPPRCWAIPAH